MKDDVTIRELRGEIRKTQALLDKIDGFYQDFKATDFQTLGKKPSTGIVLAEIFTDYYTCLETLFLRISRFFENNLRQARWHSDLLYRHPD